MHIETSPTDKPYDKPEGECCDLLIVNTGDCEGKSTAAFGLTLRAHGRGKPAVYMLKPGGRGPRSGS
jgi:cob(I)alamin adenosyltransferase